MWARPFLVCLDATPPLLLKPHTRLLASGTAYISHGRHRILRGRRDLRTAADSAAGTGTGTDSTTGTGARKRVRKTKTTVRLEDLPQGLLAHVEPPQALPEKDAQDAPEPAPANDDEGPSYPTVVSQARRNMIKFNNCVLLTRVGGFYELYFDHAEEYGPLLNLKVAQKRTSAGSVPMVTTHLRALLSLSLFVCRVVVILPVPLSDIVS